MFTNFARSFTRLATRHTAKLSVPLLFTFYHFNKNVSFLEMPETSDIIKGIYENKIRRSSPIEKIFEVFATVKTEEGLRMSFFDLMRAICPFNYSTKDIHELKVRPRDLGLCGEAAAADDHQAVRPRQLQEHERVRVLYFLGLPRRYFPLTSEHP